MGTDLNQSGKLVYVRGPQLWDGGENGESGRRVEPVHGENGLNERINSGVGVEGDGWFMVRAPRVFNEGREVMEIEGDLHGIRAVS